MLFQKDIDCIFTKKVTDLLAQGFTLNPATMCNLDGEIAKVDLRKGDEIVRVWIQQNNVYATLDGNTKSVLTIRVGRNTNPGVPHRSYTNGRPSIWNKKLEILDEEQFLMLADGVYGSPEEWAEAKSKHVTRRDNCNQYGWRNVSDNPQVREIVLRYLRRQPHMKRCRLSDIQIVIRDVIQLNGRELVTYRVYAKGQTYTICAKSAQT